MLPTGPVEATADTVKGIIDLAQSQHQFLSIYLTTAPFETTIEGVRLRLTTLLDRLEQELAGATVKEAFRRERAVVESLVQSLRPGSQGLAVLSSQEAAVWHALWLPAVVPEQVRFRRGAYVLPLVDLLDEWEPVGFASVAKDRARLMVLAAGRIEESLQVGAEVPGKHKAGGWASARYQRHHRAHAEDHLKQVAQELHRLYQRHPFRRLFLAGPTEALALFKPHLSPELRSRFTGDLTIDAHAPDAEVRAHVLREAQTVERREELALVQEIVTRAAKGQGAVAGLATTLWAINRREVRLLALDGERAQQGRTCSVCHLLLPPEDVTCSQCNRRTVTVDLREELLTFTFGHHVVLEVVHGEAASQLGQHDGIGALLRSAIH